MLSIGCDIPDCAHGHSAVLTCSRICLSTVSLQIGRIESLGQLMEQRIKLLSRAKELPGQTVFHAHTCFCCEHFLEANRCVLYVQPLFPGPVPAVMQLLYEMRYATLACGDGAEAEEGGGHHVASGRHDTVSC